MYSRDIQYIDLKKSCIHATYHKSRHYLTLMTDIGIQCHFLLPGIQCHLMDDLFPELHESNFAIKQVENY